MIRRISWSLLILLIVLWPPIYSVFVHPIVDARLNPEQLSLDQTQEFLNIRRYTVVIPPELDGYTMKLEGIRKGEVMRSGGSSVRGGSQITLLLRRIRALDKIEYAWFDSTGRSGGVMDDPLVGAGTYMTRSEMSAEAGDWLFRGGTQSVTASDTEPAEFELRLMFTAP